MIAAVALANESPLFTCNPGDFAGIEGLVVVQIDDPDRSSAPGRPAPSPSHDTITGHGTLALLSVML